MAPRRLLASDFGFRIWDLGLNFLKFEKGAWGLGLRFRGFVFRVGFKVRILALAILLRVDEGLEIHVSLKSCSHRSGGPSSFQQLLSIPLVLHRKGLGLRFLCHPFSPRTVGFNVSGFRVYGLGFRGLGFRV